LHEALRDKAILERLASTDPLTEVANRRHFEERLKIELDRAVRHGRPTSLAMLDIDRFKLVNDERGHLAGDDLLRKVARLLEKHVRSLDFVARLGGDEFALILPETPIGAAAAVGERVRHAVESSLGPSTTISVGVACYPEHGAGGSALLAAADRALYRAKSQGRNQTAVASGA
jgi:diguanylate cyclase (GGDEF)-like protein